MNFPEPKFSSTDTAILLKRSVEWVLRTAKANAIGEEPGRYTCSEVIQLAQMKGRAGRPAGRPKKRRHR